MDLLQDKRIAIIGGGPGGLTLARLLQLKGANVKVYERDLGKAVRLQGGALDLHTESGLAALKQAGLLDAFKTNYRPGAEKIRVVDAGAKVYYDEHLKERKANFGDKHHRPEIDRGPLRDILLNSLTPGTVVWDSHIVSLELIENRWKIILQNGNISSADIIIGADGANSKVRPFVTPVKPVWAGVTMIEGVVYEPEKTAPRVNELLKGGKIFAYGNEQTLFVSSKGDGSLGFAVCCKTNESWVSDSSLNFKNNGQVLAWFKTEFSGWDSIWYELFASEKSIFIPRPQYCMPLDQFWEAKPTITLIGDAAHWMPPFAGEGVNMAMLDALELSNALANPNYSDLKTATALYESRMFKRFVKVGRGTLFNTQWMHEPKALENMLNMFSGNLFKRMLFIGKMWTAMALFPFFQKILRMPPKQNKLVVR